ncbi:hypothetical protein [Paenibacillus sp. MMO-58]|uniref:hypothetical protein n=1 Tax=Paenibacillus sp. MMO-58 TaxID=3081290 RepID=UPI0030190274
MRYVGIDPSSTTGFVALDEQGEVIRKKELTGIGKVDPKRIGTLVDEIIAHVQPGDMVCVEGYSYSSKGKGISFQFGLGAMIRDRLWRKGIEFIDVPPAALKKFATGKGNTKKEDMVNPIFERWGFSNPSDNVTDAFVLAQIAKELHEAQQSGYIKKVPIHQGQVIGGILGIAL